MIGGAAPPDVDGALQEGDMTAPPLQGPDNGLLYEDDGMHAVLEEGSVLEEDFREGNSRHAEWVVPADWDTRYFSARDDTELEQEVDSGREERTSLSELEAGDSEQEERGRGNPKPSGFGTSCVPRTGYGFF